MSDQQQPQSPRRARAQGNPNRITFGSLLSMAKSGDAEERKRAFGLFTAWCKKAPELPANQRLTKMERDVLQQLFAQRGFKVERT